MDLNLGSATSYLFVICKLLNLPVSYFLIYKMGMAVVLTCVI